MSAEWRIGQSILLNTNGVTAISGASSDAAKAHEPSVRVANPHVLCEPANSSLSHTTRPDQFFQNYHQQIYGFRMSVIEELMRFPGERVHAESDSGFAYRIGRTTCLDSLIKSEPVF